MKFEYWEYDNQLLELLFDSNLSVREMSKEMGIPESKINLRIKMLGLDWIPRRQKNVSRGQAALTLIMKKLLPGAHIVNEYQIGEGLRLDVYCPQYRLAAEYHGRQHFEYLAHFYDTLGDFHRAQERDQRKIELCEEQGITLISFRYCDKLTEDVVFDRMLEAMRASVDVPTPAAKSRRTSVKSNPLYQELKAKRNAHQRELRQQIKHDRKVREQSRQTEDEEPDSLAWS